MTTFRNVLAAVSASLPCCSVAATGEAILTAKLLKPMLGDCSIKRRLTNTEWQVTLLTSGKVVWDVCPQVLCISAVSNFVLHFTGGYYKTTLNRWTEILRHAPRARLCLHMPFRVLCAVRTWLQNCWWLHCMLLFVQLFASSQVWGHM